TRVRSASALLFDILNQFSNMLQLPSVYNSFVRRDRLESIRGKNGLIFNSSIPDWYSGFALISSMDRYGESGVPLRINGVSSKSNGHEFIRGVPNRIQEEFDRLNATNGIPWNSSVPRVSMSVAAMAAECLQQLRESARHRDSRLDVNPRDLM